MAARKKTKAPEPPPPEPREPYVAPPTPRWLPAGPLTPRMAALEGASPSEFVRALEGAAPPVSSQFYREQAASRRPDLASALSRRPDLATAVEAELLRPPRSAPTRPSPVFAPLPEPEATFTAEEEAEDTEPHPGPLVVSRAGAAPLARRDVPQRGLTPASRDSAFHDQVKSCTRDVLIGALERTGGNKRQAALALGLSRQGFYKALARVGLPTSA